MKKVSLYVPCFNAEKTLAACLESALKQSYPVAEVLVVDDGSTDRTAEIAASYRVRVLRHEANKGLAAARNTAIRNTDAEFIGSLDADCVAESDWLSRLMEPFDSSQIAGAGGRLVEDRLGSVFDRWRSVHMGQAWSSGTEHPPFLFGANTVFRRKALLEAGSYNESLRRNFEDVDLSRRLIGSGQKLIYRPEAVVHHWKEDDIVSLFNTYWAWHREYYFEKDFYSGEESFFSKIEDNIGLANRFLQEDLAGGRHPLLYLDFFLALHHSLKDLEYFLFRETDENGAETHSRLSPWLALVDLTFSLHYLGWHQTVPSLLRLKERLSLNLFALLLGLDQRLGEQFPGGGFNRSLYRHLLFSVYRGQDPALESKLSGLLEQHPGWGEFLGRRHLLLNSGFLRLSQMIHQWLDRLNSQSPDILKALEASQKEVDRDFNQKGHDHEDQ